MDGDREFWSARKAMRLLGYGRWENVKNVIHKAISACRNSGSDPADQFVDINKLVAHGSGAKRQIADVRMTRLAMYFLAMNGDPEKPEIAAAQQYFVIQTRRAELTTTRSRSSPYNSCHVRRVGEHLSHLWQRNAQVLCDGSWASSVPRRPTA
jgi:hypothetical protein